MKSSYYLDGLTKYNSESGNAPSKLLSKQWSIRSGIDGYDGSGVSEVNLKGSF